MESRKKKSGHRAVPREKNYHHGDLAAALVEAAEAVLTERGVEGFTLRECARRSGVSHAAPAHHFRDAKGLLTEVAAVGFDRLTQAQRLAREAEPELKDQLLATGTAYVAFALAHPAQFQLMFQSGLLDHDSARFREAGRAAFAIFAETFEAVRKVRVEYDVAKSSDPAVLHQWALVHGIATLAIQGQLGPNRSKQDMARLVGFARKMLEDAQRHDAGCA